MKTLVLLAVTIALFAGQAVAGGSKEQTGSKTVKCWSCTNYYSSDGSCDEFRFNPNSASSYSNCNYCMKTVSGSDPRYVVRQCMPACVESHTSVLGYSYDIYCCQSDNCNGAVSTRVAVATLAVFLLAALFFQRRL